MTVCSPNIVRPLSSENLETLPKKKGKVFTVGSFMDLTKSNNAEESLFLLDAVCSLGYNVMILLKGDDIYQKQSLALQKKYPKNIKVLEDVPANRESIIKKSDVYFSGNYPENALLNVLIENGIVPVIPNSGSFINFDPQAESGNGFTFKQGNFWQMMEALVRARETRKFSYDWRNIRQSVRQTVI